MNQPTGDQPDTGPIDLEAMHLVERVSDRLELVIAQLTELVTQARSTSPETVDDLVSTRRLFARARQQLSIDTPDHTKQVTADIDAFWENHKQR